ncbi:MAG TPA: OstA-like protein [Saprospiraceae bacterium]|nr:OstA-like protein [Saprospiraceae bacterium]
MRIKTLIIYILFTLPLTIGAQTRQPAPDTASKKLIIIDYFGNLIEDREGIESVKWISDGLQLRIDSTNIYADSAVIFAESRIYAYGNVVIQQGDSLHVFTDTLYYYKETDIAELKGEVVLEQGTRQLWTKDLTYNLGDRFGEYHNGGTLIDGDMQVTSRQGIYQARAEKVIFKDSVVVLHPKFNIAADSMTYLASVSRVLFTGPTNIYTKAAKIYTESGFYDLKAEMAEFNRNAQYAGDQKKATADTIRYFSKEGEVKMSGHVLVEENDRKINGDQLRYLEKTGETWIQGEPAYYSDDTRKIHSTEIFYNEKTNTVTTKGKGEIREGAQILTYEQFDMDQLTGVGHASGNVRWRDTTRNVGIVGDHLETKQNSYMLVYGDPRPRFYTLIENDTLYIAADTLNMWTQIDTLNPSDSIRMIRAYHDVRIFKSNMQGAADSLVFREQDSLFTFYGLPVLWSDTTQFTADTIQMHLRNNQIKDIILNRRAMIISEEFGTYYDQIKGKRIVADFDSSEIKQMWVTGNAESIYYTKDDQSAFVGVNQTICSKMFFEFSEGQIYLLKYYGDNSSTMLPMSEANHNSMRLEGFQWRTEDRPRNVNDLLK